MLVRRLLLSLTIAGCLVVFTLPATAAQPPLAEPTIQSLIDAAPNGGTVSVPAGTFVESLTVNKDLVLSGQGPDVTILQASPGNRVVTISPNHAVTLQHLTIRGGRAPGGAGGGILADNSSLAVADCVISGNSADYGGGIFQDWSGGDMKPVTITRSVIQDNVAAATGGGLYVRGELRMTETDVLRNRAGVHGGGVHADIGAAIVEGGRIADNQAGGNGGGLNVNYGLQLTGVVVSGNQSGADGGGALQWNAGQQVTVQGGRFEDNRARTHGGGLWARANTSVTGATFSGNSASSGNSDNSSGGGLYVTIGSVQVTNATFTGNYVDCVGCMISGGGGIEADRAVGSATPTTILNSTFEFNRAWDGSAVSSSGEVLVVKSSRFTSNGTQGAKLAGYGGAIGASAAAIEGSVFLGNQVSNQGGALAVGGTLSVDRSEFRDNSAAAGGGGMWASGPAVLTNVLLVGNTGRTGAALLLYNNVERVLRHVTIASPALVNAAAVSMSTEGADGKVGKLDVRNTIITNHNTGVEVGTSAMTGSFTTGYSLYKNTTNFAGTPLTDLGHTLLGVDPLFARAAGDYRLAPSSPAVDSGADLGITIDLVGTPRPQGRGYDMGAYELTLKVFLPLLRR